MDDLLSEVQALAISPLRVCSEGHRIAGDDIGSMTRCNVIGRNDTCGGTIYPGWLIEAEPEVDGTLVRDVPAILDAAAKGLTAWDLMVDLHERLEKAGFEVHGLCSTAWAENSMVEYKRLLGKHEGIQLALGFLREAMRQVPAAPVDSPDANQGREPADPQGTGSSPVARDV